MKNSTYVDKMLNDLGSSTNSVGGSNLTPN